MPDVPFIGAGLPRIKGHRTTGERQGSRYQESRWIASSLHEKSRVNTGAMNIQKGHDVGYHKDLLATRLLTPNEVTDIFHGKA